MRRRLLGAQARAGQRRRLRPADGGRGGLPGAGPGVAGRGRGTGADRARTGRVAGRLRDAAALRARGAAALPSRTRRPGRSVSGRRDRHRLALPGLRQRRRPPGMHRGLHLGIRPNGSTRPRTKRSACGPRPIKIPNGPWRGCSARSRSPSRGPGTGSRAGVPCRRRRGGPAPGSPRGRASAGREGCGEPLAQPGDSGIGEFRGCRNGRCGRPCPATACLFVPWVGRSVKGRDIIPISVSDGDGDLSAMRDSRCLALWTPVPGV